MCRNGRGPRQCTNNNSCHGPCGSGTFGTDGRSCSVSFIRSICNFDSFLIREERPDLIGLSEEEKRHILSVIRAAEEEQQQKQEGKKDQWQPPKKEETDQRQAGRSSSRGTCSFSLTMLNILGFELGSLTTKSFPPPLLLLLLLILFPLPHSSILILLPLSLNLLHWPPWE